MLTVIDASESGVYMTKAALERYLKDSVLGSAYERLQIKCRIYINRSHEYTLIEFLVCEVSGSSYVMCLKR